MARSLVLPYFASPNCIPATLPSISDIFRSNDILTNWQESKIVRVGEHFVVKYGAILNLQEGENMIFVKRVAHVRVPTVYALFRDEKTGYNFIIQEYIPGQSLDTYWKTLNQKGKEDVTIQLRQYFSKLRSVSPSTPYFGGVWQQPVLDCYLAGRNKLPDSKSESDYNSLIIGPHQTEEQWVDAMLQKAQAKYQTTPIRFNQLKQIYSSVFQGHDPVFTHGDLHRSNIRICTDNSLVLIDWEHAGWYPSCWEYCLLMAAIDFQDDWSEWVPRFLDEYNAELGWMIQFRTWVLGGRA